MWQDTSTEREEWNRKLNCMILTADSLQVRKDGGLENFTLSSCVLLLILVLAPTPRLS